MTTETITHPLRLSVVVNGTPTPMLVDFSWTAAAPLEVQLGLYTGGDEPVIWAVARDLLLEGMGAGLAGVGDVTVQSQFASPTVIEITLGAREPAPATVLVARAALRRFLAITTNAVPVDADLVITDDHLAELLGPDTGSAA
jgi:hypothetical protein